MTPTVGSAVDELVEGVGDRVVVDRAQQGDERVVLVVGPARPVVRPGVRGGLVTVLGQPVVQLARLVERRAVGVDRRLRVGREHQGAVRAQVRVERRRDPAAEHDQALDVAAGQQGVLVAGEVEVLQA